MYSICTAYIENGKIDENLKGISKAESIFTKEIGVLFRKFFQCQTQPHIIWSLTEWETEGHHNRAAKSLMKTRYDDRFASIAFGPDPYFEIFCDEDETIKIGDYSKKIEHIIVMHGLIGEKVKSKYLTLRKERRDEYRDKIQWLSVFNNRYNSHEFVAFMGFINEEKFTKVRKVGELLLEEYLFTGLRKQFGMSLIASYNQFICKPLVIEKITSDS
ncbi:MAG: hypothetical protein ACXAEU_19320 [Candidatus Hodarchaeales archaeon]|jgi:hypothetical protein